MESTALLLPAVLFAAITIVSGGQWTQNMEAAHVPEPTV